MLLDQITESFTQIVDMSVAVLVDLVIIVVLLRGITVAKPDEAIIVTSRQRTPQEHVENAEMENLGQRVVVGSRVVVSPIRFEGTAGADSTRAQAEALAERAETLLKQRIIDQLPEIVRAAAEPLGAIQNMTVISSEGTGTNQLGENLAGRLATTTTIIKDPVGIDIAELITGRVVGETTGAAAAAMRCTPTGVVTFRRCERRNRR